MPAFTLTDLALIGVISDPSAFGIAGGGGDTFDGYLVQNPITQTLNGGTAWSGAWVWGDSEFGPQGAETFDGYALGETDGSGLNDTVNTGLTGSWVFATSEFGLQGFEDFDGYALGATDGTGLNTGLGFTGDWVFADA